MIFWKICKVGLLVKVLMLTASLLLQACAESDQTSVADALKDNPENREALLAHGSRQSRLCLGCHGPAGISRVASYPSIAGKSQDYLATELSAFRSGVRENPMMASVAKSLSDRDIQALSLYYSLQTKVP